MVPNLNRVYALGAFTVEKKVKGWFFRKTYGDDTWHGPYSSESSVCLMIARQLERELAKRDRLQA